MQSPGRLGRKSMINSDGLFALPSLYSHTVVVQRRPRFLPFLQDAEQKHERFLAVGYNGQSYSLAELDWIARTAAETYSVRTVGIYDDVKVLEFLPRSGVLPRED
jgi:hypothetical protein